MAASEVSGQEVHRTPLAHAQHAVRRDALDPCRASAPSGPVVPSLKAGYEKATQKYNNDYQEVLWAVADDSSLRRQVKEIYDSYKRIMGRHYRGKEVMDLTKFYNRMNALRTDRHGI